MLQIVLLRSLGLSGYHKNKINRGEIGELSKIQEELEELKDAIDQDCKIMAMLELSDLYGAIELFAQKHYGITMDDIKRMSEITQRAFISGARK